MTRKRYDPTDPDQVAQRAEDVVVRNDQRKHDWQWLLADPRGKRIMIDLLRQFRLFSPSYVSGDPGQTSFNEGVRANGMIVFHSILTNTSQEAICDILKGLTDTHG